MLQAEGDLFLFVVDVQDHHLDLVVDLDHFGRVIDAAPAHVGDVEQTVDTAQIDERAEIGDVFDDALAHLADFQLLEQLRLLLRPLGLDQAAAADDDVPAGFVDLQHQALDLFADVLADIVRPADIDLAGRQKYVNADIDQEAAFDLPRHHTADDVPFVDGLHDLHPLFDLLGLPLGQHDHAAIVLPADDVFQIFDQHANRLTDLRRLFALFPFVARDDAFAFIADVDQHEVVVDPQHAALDDLIRAYVLALEPFHVLGQGLPDGVELFVFGNVKFADEIAVNHVSIEEAAVAKAETGHRSESRKGGAHPAEIGMQQVGRKIAQATTRKGTMRRSRSAYTTDLNQGRGTNPE